jgi:hypothetical protein
MSNKSKAPKSGEDFLQFRVKRAEKRGAELIAKLEKISETNGLSMNDVANMAIAAGLPMVETKLREIHEPADRKAA